MLLIKRNQLNNLVVTASQQKTIASPQYLFSFTHIVSQEKVRFYPKNITTHETRYDEFQFYEGDKPLGYAGDIPYEVFPYPGQYYYSIYEMFSTATTNPNYAFTKLEEGRAEVEDTFDYNFYTPYTAGNENNENFVYYPDGTNESEYVVGLVIQGNNPYATEAAWSVSYPNIIITNTYSLNNSIFNIPVDLYGTDLCGNPVSYSADTSYQGYNLGATGSITLTLNTGQMTAWGYDYYPGGLTGITYNNFTQSIAPIVECTRTLYYEDGTSSSSIISFNSQSPNTITPIEFGITGNTAACVFNYILFEDGDIITAENGDLVQYEF